MRKSKYTDYQWKLIILEYWISNVNQYELASKYNISQSVIAYHMTSTTANIVIEIKNKMEENNMTFEEARKTCEYPAVFTKRIYSKMNKYIQRRMKDND